MKYQTDKFLKLKKKIQNMLQNRFIYIDVGFSLVNHIVNRMVKKNTKG